MRPLIFQMDYGPNDREICTLYEGRVDPAQVHFDPLEVEWIAAYSLAELDALIQAGRVAFSDWFVQLIRWNLGKPSGLHVMKSYTPKRSLLARSKPPSGYGLRAAATEASTASISRKSACQ